MSMNMKNSTIMSGSEENANKQYIQIQCFDFSEFQKMEKIIDEINKKKKHDDQLQHTHILEKSVLKRKRALQEDFINEVILFKEEQQLIKESQNSENEISEYSYYSQQSEESNQNQIIEQNLILKNKTSKKSPKLKKRLSNENEEVQDVQSGYEGADDEENDSFQIPLILQKQNKSVYYQNDQPNFTPMKSPPTKNKMSSNSQYLMNLINQFGSPLANQPQFLQQKTLNKVKRSFSYDELQQIKKLQKLNQNRKQSQNILVNNEVAKKEVNLEDPNVGRLSNIFYSAGKNNLQHSFSLKEDFNKINNGSSGVKINLKLIDSDEQHEKKKKRYKKKKKRTKQKAKIQEFHIDNSDTDQQNELLKPFPKKGNRSPSPGKTPKFYSSPSLVSPKAQSKIVSPKIKQIKTVALDESPELSIDLSDEEQKYQNHNNVNRQQSGPSEKINDSQEEVIQVEQQRYKLTTSRYQGMLEESYNSDDLEIMKTNSQRNFMSSKSEVTWFYRDDYNNNVRMSVNVIRAFGTMLTVFTLIVTIQKHYFKAKHSRLRYILPADLALIFNRQEFPLFIFEFLVVLIHFPPFLDSIEWFQKPLHLNIIFQFLVIIYWLKITQCLELIHHYSPVNSNKGRFVGSLSKTQITTSFLVKAWIKSHPLTALPSGIFSFLISNAYVLYVFERGSFPTDCYMNDRNAHTYTFSNCLWCTVISFLTVGYGDFYPTSIMGRSVNTVIIIGGMVSSATIIGLVHEYMQLSNEEYHVFRFIKTRRKEVLRKKLAAKLIQILLKMQVQRSKELNKGNIKWRQASLVQKLKNELFRTIEQWKKINNELYVTHRRDHDQMSQMTHLRNIEENLSGIVVEGAKIYDGIKTEKMQRQLNIEQSFIKSKLDVQKIEEDLVKQTLMQKYQFQRFKTQRFGHLLDITKQKNQSTYSFNNSVRQTKPLLVNRLGSKLGFGQSEQEYLSQSSLTSKQNIGLKSNMPVINVTNLDKSHTHSAMNMQPINRFSSSGKSLLALSMKINESFKPNDELLNGNKFARQLSRNHISNLDEEKKLKKQEEQENDEMVSELISDSSSSSQEFGQRKSMQSENVQQQLAKHLQNSSYSSQQNSYRLDSPDSIPKMKKIKSDEQQDQSQFGKSYLNVYKKTRTQVTSSKRNNNMNSTGNSNFSSGIDLALMNRFHRQNSNIVNRDFVIEEDFEEDQTTPVSRQRRFNDFSNAVTSPRTMAMKQLNSEYYGRSAPSNLQKEETKKSTLEYEHHNTYHIQKAQKQELENYVENQQNNMKRQFSQKFKHRKFSLFKKPKQRKTSINMFMNLNSIKSDKSLIQAVDDLKFEMKRDREIEESKKNLFQQFNKGHRIKYKGFHEVQNLEIEKKIQTTRRFKREQGKKIFNSDSSSLYGSKSYSREQYKNSEVSPTKRSKKVKFSDLRRKERSAKQSQQNSEIDSDQQTERTAKEYKLFGQNYKPSTPGAVIPEETLSGRRNRKNLQVEVPKSSPKKQQELKKTSLNIQENQDNNAALIQQQTVQIQGLIRQNSLLQQLQNQQILDLNRLNLIQQYSSGSIAQSYLSPMQPQQSIFQFSGKSPIKFQKQNTTFSEQSVKEMQKLLEPIDSQSPKSNFVIQQYLVANNQQQQLQQQLLNISPSFQQLSISNSGVAGQLYNANILNLDRSILNSPVRIQQQSFPSQQNGIQQQQLQNTNNNYFINIIGGNNTETFYNVPSPIVKNRHHGSQKLLTNEIGQLRNALLIEKQSVVEADKTCEQVDKKLTELRNKILQKFSGMKNQQTM